MWGFSVSRGLRLTATQPHKSAGASPRLPQIQTFDCILQPRILPSPGSATCIGSSSKICSIALDSLMASAQPIPWEQIVPTAQNTSPEPITRNQVLEMLSASQKLGVDFLLIDVRREDHQGSTISGSLNMPIHTLHQSLATLRRLCEQAKIRTVIFYCGHSTGRGPRAAGLFDDELKRSHTGTDVTSMYLVDGFNGWSLARGDFEEFTIMPATDKQTS